MSFRAVRSGARTLTGGSDGAIPSSSLILDGEGNLYGTTIYGGDLSNQWCVAVPYDPGCGVVFELSPVQGGGWEETVLHTFEGPADGAFPRANLVLDASGNLYGAASAGGTGTECITNQLPGCGTIFELSPNGSGVWAESTIYQFQGLLDGGLPEAGMTFDQSGNLYGTTIFGGLQDYGNVFELSPPQLHGGSWIESTVYSFTASAPERTSVIFDPQGNLYGTTDSGTGSVFELMESGGVWTENTIYSFRGNKNSTPTALVIDMFGNLYGALSGPYCGALYRLQNENDAWDEQQLAFSKGTGPCSPNALTFGKWGALYGTSGAGGSCKGLNACGTAFGILP